MSKHALIIAGFLLAIATIPAYATVPVVAAGATGAAANTNPPVATATPPAAPSSGTGRTGIPQSNRSSMGNSVNGNVSTTPNASVNGNVGAVGASVNGNVNAAPNTVTGTAVNGMGTVGSQVPTFDVSGRRTDIDNPGNNARYAEWRRQNCASGSADARCGSINANGVSALSAPATATTNAMPATNANVNVTAPQSGAGAYSTQSNTGVNAP